MFPKKKKKAYEQVPGGILWDPHRVNWEKPKLHWPTFTQLRPSANDDVMTAICLITMWRREEEFVKFSGSNEVITDGKQPKEVFQT